RIASIIGRYYAMDRDERWERTEIAYKLLIEGKGKKIKHWNEALKENYAKEKFDEVLEPYVIEDAQGNVHQINNGDAVIFFNFRPDRAVQITKAFEEDEFK